MILRCCYNLLVLPVFRNWHLAIKTPTQNTYTERVLTISAIQEYLSLTRVSQPYKSISVIQEDICHTRVSQSYKSFSSHTRLYQPYKSIFVVQEYLSLTRVSLPYKSISALLGVILKDSIGLSI